MKYIHLLTLCLLIASCGVKSNIEIAKEFKIAETGKSKSNYSGFLSEDVVASIANSSESMNKSQLISNFEFNRPFQPWNKIVKSEAPNDSVVVLHALETNMIHSIYGLDTVGYQFTYTIFNSKISKIEMDTIPYSNYNYRKVDSLYNLKIAELVDWMSFAYPEKYNQIENMDEQSAKIIIEMAKVKGR